MQSQIIEVWDDLDNDKIDLYTLLVKCSIVPYHSCQTLGVVEDHTSS